MGVRRQTWGAILSTVMMILMTFSAIVFAPVAVVSELDDGVAASNDDSVTAEVETTGEEMEKMVPSDLDGSEWPEVYYPSGLGGSTPLGEDPPGTYSYLDDLYDRHEISGAWAQGVNGSGVNIALIDTGIDLGNPNLIGTYAIDERDIADVSDEVVVEGSSAQGVTEAELAHMYVIDLDLRKNGGGLIEGIDYIFYDKKGRIEFTSPLSLGDQITASYTYTSPYYGWPIAFDPVSMSNYLENNHTRDTWFANCTQVGPGPFEYSHTLIIDGETEFGGTYEKWGTDSPDNNVLLSPGGQKGDYDLTGLNLTYDKDFWYIGFPTYMKVNMTGGAGPFVPKVLYGVMFDVNNETGGTTTVPEGKLIDTNSSHSNKVLDAEFSPDGSMVATVSEDNLVRIWYASNATRITTMYDHETTMNPPLSVAWSGDGARVASISKDRLYIWDVGDWSQPAFQLTVTDGPDLHTTPNLYDTYGFSSLLAFSPNLTAVAYGGLGKVNFWDFVDNEQYYLELSDIPRRVRTLAYKPGDSDVIAANLDSWVGVVDPFFIENAVGVYDLSSVTFGPVVNPPPPQVSLEGHTDIVLSLAWRPTGDRIVTGSDQDDMSVRVWAYPAGNEIGNTSELRPIVALDWSSNDEIAYSTVRWLSPNELPTLAILDQDGSPIRSIQGRLSWYSVDWAPDGNTLVTSSADFSARIWDRNLNLVLVLVAHKPDYALYVVGGDRYNQKDAKWEPGFQEAYLYTWDDVTGWTGVKLQDTIADWPDKPQIEAFQIFGKSQFIEFAIPRANLSDPTSMAVEMFTTPFNGTWPAFDSAHEDKNVFYMPEKKTRPSKDLAWLPIVTSLSAFTWKGIKYFYADVAMSRSGEFHFGFHPSPHLTNQLGIVGVLVVDSERPYDYDTVYVDMNVDNVFDNQDVILTRDSPTVAYAHYDPVANITKYYSGGIMYFISDGFTPLPYSEPYTERRQETDNEFKNIIPPNGDIVAFIGEFFIDEDTKEKASHGTRLASLIASQGIWTSSDLMGVAPGARFVVLANTREEIEHSWYFAVEGYDGHPGTGDEAQIVLNAFNYPRVIEKGWDTYSTLADKISFIDAKEASLFVGPGGDYGWGYGTISSPNAAPGIVTVGRASGFSRHYGDVEISSSRGPTPVGISKPDVLAIGLSETVNPLFEPQPEKVLKGGDVSSAITVGVLAMIYEGFKTRNKRFPTATEAKEILMSGADDMHNDPLSQGAGFVNAARSVSLAMGNGGLSMSPSTLTFGDYHGVEYPSFTNILAAGDTDVRTFTVFNNGNTASSATLDATIYKKKGEFYLSNYTEKDSYALDREIVFWINSSGIFKVKDEGGGVYSEHSQVGPFNATLWDDAELAKITAYSSYDMMTNVASVSPTGTKSYFKNYSYTMDIFDWTLNPMNFSYPSLQYLGDLYRMTEAFSTPNVLLGVDPMTNVMEARIHEPATRIDDGLVVALRPWGDAPDLVVKWEFLIEIYEKDDWPWLTLNPTNMPSIPAYSNQTLSATLQTPPNAKVGSYEGAITVTDGTGEVTTVPLLVNIAINSPNLEFGGVNGTSDLYDNNRIFGGYDKGMRGTTRLSRPYTGDWRFYYFDIPDAGVYKSARLKLWIEGNWTLKPSDIDFYVLGRVASNEYTGRFGPYYLKVVGKSEEAKEPGFETNTNMSSEVIAFDMKTGINVLALHGVILNGSKPFEFVFGGGGGWIQVTPPEIKERRNVRYGEKDMRLISNLCFPEGVTATAVGPAITESYKEVDIEQDYQTWWQFDNWGEYLQRGSYTKIINVSNVFILDVHIVGDDKAPDLDLGVFREDDPPDGELELEEVKDIYLVKIGGTKWDYDADADADERVVWINPPDGQYIIKVLGYDIKGKFGHFDIDISLTLGAGEKGYWITETWPNDVIVGTETGLPAYTTVGFTLHWNLQGSTPPGEYGGAVMIGTPSAPAIVIVPVTIIYDPDPPEIIRFAISAIGYEIDIVTNRTTNHPQPTLQVQLADPSRGEIDWKSAEVFLDGENITSVALILIPFTEFEGEYGYWSGTITYTPPERMAEGLHTCDARLKDITGNMAEANFTFVIDTQAPFLNINGPPTYSTQNGIATISGYTEADKTVVIREFEVVSDSSGYFEKDIILEEGMNTIDIIAVDWFGRNVADKVVRSNPSFATQTIIYDTVAPTLSDVRIEARNPTNLEFARITGIVEEFMANATPYDPRTVDLRINGEAVDLLSDGKFERLLTLSEGLNMFALVATDAAGNNASMNVSITKDTSPPSLIVDEVPSSTYDEELTITGTTEPGAILTINGRFVSVGLDGKFEDDIALQSGPNVITLEVVDSAQNVRNVQVVVVREHTDLSIYVIMVLLILIGLILGYLLGSRFRKPKEPGEEEMIEEETLVEEPSEEEVEEVLEGEPAEIEDVPTSEESLNPHIEEELIGEEG